jgi:AraC-like DNA-binding protein
MVVNSELEKLGLAKTIVTLGEVKITDGMSPAQLEKFNIALKKSGFELMERQKGILVGKIKNIIGEFAYYSEEQLKENIGEYLSKKLGHDYSYLANLFSEIQSTTIEKYFITQKIERAKELLIYYRLNLTEIAYQLNYNNIPQLSRQFKEVTGLTPSQFQKIRHIRLAVQANV